MAEYLHNTYVKPPMDCARAVADVYKAFDQYMKSIPDWDLTGSSYNSNPHRAYMKNWVGTHYLVDGAEGPAVMTRYAKFDNTPFIGVGVASRTNGQSIVKSENNSNDDNHQFELGDIQRMKALTPADQSNQQKLKSKMHEQVLLNFKSMKNLKRFWNVLIIFPLTLLVHSVYSQYNGREYCFHDPIISKYQIDSAVLFVQTKADSILSFTGFEGDLKIVIVYYQSNSMINNRKWNRFVVRLTKRIKKLGGEPEKIIISNRSPDDLPIIESYVSLSPIWN